MPRIASVERRIAQIEGFEVRILHADGTDVRSDRAVAAAYPYTRGATGAGTVRGWVRGRFAKAFPGFTVEVLDGAGRPVHGRTLLRTLRASYHDQ